MLPGLIAIFLFLQQPIEETHAPTSRPPQSSRGSMGEKQRQDFSKRVNLAYSRARFLVMEIDIRAEQYHLNVITEMAPAKLRTRVYDLNQVKRSTDKPAAAFLLINNIMSEYRAVWKPEGNLPLKNVLLQYPTVSLTKFDGQEKWILNPNGSKSTFLKEHTDCLIGSYLQSWVGPFSEKMNYFQDVIDTGMISSLPDQIRGINCLLVTRVQNQGDYHRTDRFWFDVDNSLLRRWQTLESDGDKEPKLTRSRDIVKLELSDKEPEADIWNLGFVFAAQKDAANTPRK